MPQNDILHQNPEIKQYMNTLPSFVQECIHQSGIQIVSKHQLQQCVDAMMKKN